MSRVRDGLRFTKRVLTNPGGLMWERLAKREHQKNLKGLKKKITALEFANRVGLIKNIPTLKF